MSGSIYVEVRIAAPMETVWTLTQNPARHERWDLRFTSISYLPKASQDEPQRFLYRTNIGFGLPISGEGESVGVRNAPDGSRTSALKFWSNDRRSPIEEGSGFWKYVPVESRGGEAIRFFTRYDYSPRYGRFGQLIDLVFRPLLGWATAWSFDTVRLWAERDIAPETSRLRAVVNLGVRLGLALTWLYQGLVPKLLHPDSGERALTAASGFAPALVPFLVTALGFAEIAVAVLLLATPRWRLPLWLHLPALVLLPLGLASSRPDLFVAPFNPVALSIAMLALAALALVAGRDLPSARNCLRTSPERPQR